MESSDRAAQRIVNEPDALHDVCNDAASAQALRCSNESWVPILRSTGGTVPHSTASSPTSTNFSHLRDTRRPSVHRRRTLSDSNGLDFGNEELFTPPLFESSSNLPVPKWSDHLVLCWQRLTSFCPQCCSITGEDKEQTSDTERPLEDCISERLLALPLSHVTDDHQPLSRTVDANSQTWPDQKNPPLHSARHSLRQPEREGAVERHDATSSDTGSLEPIKPNASLSFHWPGTPTPIGISILSLIWILGAETQSNNEGDQILRFTKLARLLLSFCVVYIIVWATWHFWRSAKEAVFTCPQTMLQHDVAAYTSRPLAPPMIECAGPLFASPPPSPVQEVQATGEKANFSTHAAEALEHHNQRRSQYNKKCHIPAYWKKKEGQRFPILVQVSQNDPFLRRLLETLAHPEVCGIGKNSVVKQLYEWWRTSDCRPLVPPDQWKLRPLHISSTMSKSEFEYCSMRLLFKHYPQACLECWPPDYIKRVQRSLDVNPNLPNIRFLFSSEGLIFTQSHLPPGSPASSVSPALSSKRNEFIVIPIVNDFFEGNLLVRIRGLGETGCMAYFSGRKRLTQIVVQGRFKQAIPFNCLLSGQVCELPWKSLPPTWLMNLVLSFVAVMFPSFQVDLTISKPYFLFPLVTSLQVMNIVHPTSSTTTNIPDIGDISLEEDVTLLGGPFADPTWGRNSKYRRSFFSRLENLSAYAFDPRYVYTMETYQHLLDVTRYVVNLPLRSLDLTQYMNSQAIEFSAFVERRYASLFGTTPDRHSKETDKYTKEYEQSSKGTTLIPDRSFVWRVKLWHEKLLQQ